MLITENLYAPSHRHFSASIVFCYYVWEAHSYALFPWAALSNHLLASYTTTVALPVLDRIDYGLTVPQYPSIVRIACYHNHHIHTFIAHLRHTDTPVSSTAYTLTFLLRPYSLPAHCITNIPILYTRR